MEELGGYALIEFLEPRCMMSSAPVVGAVIPTAGAGNTYYISTTGSPLGDGTEANPWATVQYALSRVGGGNTFLLQPGTYAPIYIPSQFCGTSDHPTVIQSQYKWQAVIDGTLNTKVPGVYGDWGLTDYVVVDGLKIVNAGTFGINLTANGWTARNCWVTGSKLVGIGGWGHSDMIVQNNLVENNGSHINEDHGIYLSGDGMVITGNVVRNNKSCGINVGTPVMNAVVSGNLVYGQRAGISFTSKEPQTPPLSLSITDNITLGNSQGEILSWGVRSLSEWRGNRTEHSVNGAVLDAVVSNEVEDYAALLATILPAPLTDGGAAPTARVYHSGLSAEGVRMVMVLYTSTAQIDLSRIGESNVVIKGPAGYSIGSQALKYMYLRDQGTLEVMYLLSDPVSGWMDAYSGQYSVQLLDGQVSDIFGNFAAGGRIAGGFTVNIGDNPPPWTTDSMFPGGDLEPDQSPDPPAPKPAEKSSSGGVAQAAAAQPRAVAPALNLLAEVPPLFTWDMWQSTVDQSDDPADMANWSKSFLKFFSPLAVSSASLRLEWMDVSTS